MSTVACSNVLGTVYVQAGSCLFLTPQVMVLFFLSTPYIAFDTLFHFSPELQDHLQ